MPSSPTKGRVDPVLTNYSRSYAPAEYIGKIVFPVQPVVQISGVFYTYDRDQLITLKETAMGWRGRAPEVTMDYGTDTYAIEPYGLVDYVSPEDRENFERPLDVERDVTENLKNLLLLAYEVQAAAVAATSGNYDAAAVQTLVGNAQWSDAANSDPIANVRTAVSACAMPPNLCVMSEAVFDKLIDHPDVIDRVKYTGSDVPNEQTLAKLFKVDKVVVGKAKKKVAGTESYVWGDMCGFYRVEPNPTPKSPCYGKTFARTEDDQVRTWEVPDRGPNGSDAIQVHWNRVIKVAAQSNGAVILDCLA